MMSTDATSHSFPLHLILFLSPLLTLWRSLNQQRCPQCNRQHHKSNNFCAGCGFQLEQSAKRLSAPMDGSAVLRKVHKVLFAYIAGFVVVWSIPFIFALPHFGIIVASYPVMGAAVVTYCYTYISRCSACNHFVQLGESKESSAMYCSHCGNLVNSAL